MRRWPQTIGVFLQFRMKCVGCPIGIFHTVEDSCREHGVDPETFIAALRHAVAEVEGQADVQPSANWNNLCESRSTMR
jgi:hybrid cluster-associated redox disulfide protein